MKNKKDFRKLPNIMFSFSIVAAVVLMIVLNINEYKNFTDGDILAGLAFIFWGLVMLLAGFLLHRSNVEKREKGNKNSFSSSGPYVGRQAGMTWSQAFWCNVSVSIFGLALIALGVSFFFFSW